ncbi:hypothetical protein QBC32DRAFT_214589 [Pseudoneurospora amorphoporcata]|uniref:Uncharacterized protein n=1 Tax=Pseudoneurospora amorphoporcata TaxID=241081 RepID=A0AAN6SET5_9PEZI|nr:hypothetical protein QBC32DRAFT_214589 [Pseudoneurospora amorphoporcata]
MNWLIGQWRVDVSDAGTRDRHLGDWRPKWDDGQAVPSDWSTAPITALRLVGELPTPCRGGTPSPRRDSQHDEADKDIGEKADISLGPWLSLLVGLGGYVMLSCVLHSKTEKMI